MKTPAAICWEPNKPLEIETPEHAESARKTLKLMVEGLLDQSLFLSLVDAEAHMENYLTLPDGRLGFSSVPSLAPVPVCHESKWPPTITISSLRSLPGISAMVL